MILVVSTGGMGVAAPVVITFAMHKYKVSLEKATDHVLYKKESVQLEPVGVIEAMKGYQKTL